MRLMRCDQRQFFTGFSERIFQNRNTQPFGGLIEFKVITHRHIEERGYVENFVCAGLERQFQWPALVVQQIMMKLTEGIAHLAVNRHELLRLIEAIPNVERVELVTEYALYRQSHAPADARPGLPF